MTGPDRRNLSLTKSISSMKMDNFNSWSDMMELQANNLFVPLFVYGCEQRDMSDHFRIKRSHSVYLGTGVTVDRGFIMVKDKKWTTPLVFNQPKAPTAAHLYGEVYLVEPETVFEMDSQYERGAFSRRHRRVVSYTDLSEKKKRRFLTSCFMYTHIFDLFKDKIKEGEHELMRTVADWDTSVPIFRWFENDDKPNQERLKKMQEATAKIKAETEATARSMM